MTQSLNEQQSAQVERFQRDFRVDIHAMASQSITLDDRGETTYLPDTIEVFGTDDYFEVYPKNDHVSIAVVKQTHSTRDTIVKMAEVYASLHFDDHLFEDYLLRHEGGLFT